MKIDEKKNYKEKEMEKQYFYELPIDYLKTSGYQRPLFLAIDVCSYVKLLNYLFHL